MSKAILIGVLALIVAVGVTGVGMYFSYWNQAVEMETAIEAQYDSNRNTLSNTTTRVMEMAQVNEMYRDDLKDIVEATFQGRYGDDGSRSAWQWIQEQNPELDSSVYTNLQATIEAGRNEFKTSQDRLIDYVRQYERFLRRPLSGFFARLSGFPELDLDYYDILVEGSVQDRFDNKQDEVLNLRPDGA